jgi:hypothetical protein
VDPHRFTEAITGLNSGFLAVVATLKLQFAKVKLIFFCFMLTVYVYMYRLSHSAMLSVKCWKFLR